MKIRDLIDELIQTEAETSPDEEVLVDLRVPGSAEWVGCIIEGTGRDEDGSVVIRAVTP